MVIAYFITIICFGNLGKVRSWSDTTSLAELSDTNEH